MITKEEFLELKEKERLLKKAAGILKVREDELSRVVERFLKETK